MVESKSLKLYLFSFRNHGDFHEDCVNIIMKDLVKLMEPKYLEVKGVTLEDNNHAMFPDAPTDRGARHLKELVEAKKRGYGAGVLFLIQMDGVKSFSPNDERDPKFGEALRYAYNNGVDILAYNCNVTNEGIEINEKIKIILD